ncbi:hypothetical protein EIN_282090 [Entamoeba invadens IP1]|uniref:EF-hand domain-containing protein n=1 Tax=Entamoeba invadens IP1 TaxID=370355 RepID=A0A0A1TX48_ENTIV|nr:hypothetical protein EIN_282090 [Entamoeba invadens IP1]ELP85838.1 hypothetical protein EIN_282090 [Entamoeba invadens IP1]|eukprot:XP_004185184.1 hypothetical protein EIN_282090 [Entamoeba invadens IP1]
MYDTEVIGELNVFQIRRFILSTYNITLSIEQIRQFLSELVISKNGRISKAEFIAFKQSLFAKKDEFLLSQTKPTSEIYGSLPFTLINIQPTDIKTPRQQDLTRDFFYESSPYHRAILSLLFDPIVHYSPLNVIPFTNQLGTQYYSSQRSEQVVRMGTLPKLSQVNREPDVFLFQNFPALSELFVPDVNLAELSSHLFFLPKAPKYFSKIETFVVVFLGTTLESAVLTEDLFFSISFHNLRSFDKVSSNYTTSTAYRTESLEYSTVAQNTFAIQLDPTQEYAAILRVYRRYTNDLQTIREIYARPHDENEKSKDLKLKSKTPRTNFKQFVMSGVFLVKNSLKNLNKGNVFYGLKFYKDEGMKDEQLLKDVIAGKAKECLGGMWGIKIEKISEYKTDYLVIEKCLIKQNLEDQPAEAKTKKQAKIPLVCSWENKTDWSIEIHREYSNELVGIFKEISIGKELKKSVLKVKVYLRTGENGNVNIKAFLNGMNMDEVFEASAIGKGMGLTDEIVINLPFILTDMHHLYVQVQELNIETLEEMNSYSGILKLCQRGVIIGSGEKVIGLYKGMSSNYYTDLSQYQNVNMTEGSPHITIELKLNSSVYPSSSDLHAFLINKTNQLSSIKMTDVMAFLPLVIQRYLNIANDKNYTEFFHFFDVLDEVYGVDTYSTTLVSAIENYNYIIPNSELILEKQTFTVLSKVLLNLPTPSDDTTRKFLKFSWVIFLLIVKSINTYQITLRQTNGDDDVKNAFLGNLEVMKQIRKELSVGVLKISGLIRESVLTSDAMNVREGNSALAQFLVRMLNIWNRGDVSKMMENHLDILANPISADGIHVMAKDSAIMQYLSLLRIEFCEVSMLMEGFFKSSSWSLKCEVCINDDKEENLGYPVNVIIRNLLSVIHRGKDEGRLGINVLAMIVSCYELDGSLSKSDKEKAFSRLMVVVLKIIEDWEIFSKWKVSKISESEDLEDIKTLYFSLLTIIRNCPKDELRQWVTNEVSNRIEILIENLRRANLVFSFFPNEFRPNPRKVIVEKTREVVALLGILKSPRGIFEGNSLRNSKENRFDKEIERKELRESRDMKELRELNITKEESKETFSENEITPKRKETAKDSILATPRAFRLSKKIDQQFFGTPIKLPLSTPQRKRTIVKPLDLTLSEKKMTITHKDEGMIERGRVLVTEIAKTSMDIMMYLLDRVNPSNSTPVSRCECIPNQSDGETSNPSVLKNESERWEEQLWEFISKTLFEVSWSEYYSVILREFINSVMAFKRVYIFGINGCVRNSIMESIVTAVNDENPYKRSDGLKMTFVFSKNDFLVNGNIENTSNGYKKAICESGVTGKDVLLNSIEEFEMTSKRHFTTQTEELKNADEKYRRMPGAKKWKDWSEMNYGKLVGKIYDQVSFREDLNLVLIETIGLMRVDERRTENDGVLAEVISKLKKFKVEYLKFGEGELFDNFRSKKISEKYREVGKLEEKVTHLIFEIDKEVEEGMEMRRKREDMKTKAEQMMTAVSREVVQLLQPKPQSVIQHDIQQSECHSFSRASEVLEICPLSTKHPEELLLEKYAIFDVHKQCQALRSRLDEMSESLSKCGLRRVEEIDAMLDIISSVEMMRQNWYDATLELSSIESSLLSRDEKSERKAQEWSTLTSTMLRHWSSDLIGDPCEIEFLVSRKKDLDVIIRRVEERSEKVRKSVQVSGVVEKGEVMWANVINSSEKVVQQIYEVKRKYDIKVEMKKKQEGLESQAEELRYLVGLVFLYEKVKKEIGEMESGVDLISCELLIQVMREIGDGIYNYLTRIDDIVVNITKESEEVKEKLGIGEVLNKVKFIYKEEGYSSLSQSGGTRLKESSEVFIEKRKQLEGILLRFSELVATELRNETGRKLYKRKIEELLHKTKSAVITSEVETQIWLLYDDIRKMEDSNIEEITRYVSRSDEGYIGRLMKIDPKKLKKSLGSPALGKFSSMIFKDGVSPLREKERETVILNLRNEFDEESSLLDVSKKLQRKYLNDVKTFKKEVGEVMKKLKILDKNTSDCDEIADKYYMFSEEYYNNPELHITWMNRLSESQKNRANFPEMANCELHMVFYLISVLKIEIDVSEIKDIYTCETPPPANGQIFETQESVFKHFERALFAMQRANFFEEAIKISRCEAKYYLKQNNFKKVLKCHEKLSNLFDVMQDKHVAVNFFLVNYREKNYIYCVGVEKELFEKMIKTTLRQGEEAHASPTVADEIIVSKVRKTTEKNTFEQIKYTKRHVVRKIYVTEVALPNVIRRSKVINAQIKRENIVTFIQQKVTKIEEIVDTVDVNAIDKVFGQIEETTRYVKKLNERKPSGLEQAVQQICRLDEKIKGLIVAAGVTGLYNDDLLEKLNEKYVQMHMSIKNLVKVMESV